MAWRRFHPWFIAALFPAAAAIALLLLPTLLPTARGSLVFLSSPNGIGDIYRVKADGSGLKNLTEDPAYYSRPVWSPDGRRIAFLRGKDCRYQVFVMADDGTNVQPVMGTTALDIPAGWSPDGCSLLVLSRRDVQAQVYAISLTSGAATRLTDDDSEKGDPTWSPDGTSIAYEARDAATMIWQIYVKNLSSGWRTRITSCEHGAVHPAWSPDGKQLAFCRIGDDGNGDACIVSAGGTTVRQVTHEAGVSIPWCWSPDGRRILVDYSPASDPGGPHRLLICMSRGPGRPREMVHSLSASAGSYGWSGEAASTISQIPRPPVSAGLDAEDKRPIALLNGTLLDGTGADPLPDAVLVVRGGHIESVGPRSRVRVPADARVVDVGGSFMLPGFINAHVHGSYSAPVLRRWLEGGVTTVCDLGGNLHQQPLFDYRDRVAANPLYARIVAAGPLLAATGGHSMSSLIVSVSSAADGARRVRWLIDRGADIIKVYFQAWDPRTGLTCPVLSRDEIASIVEAAHSGGRRVIVHADLLERGNFWHISGLRVDALAHVPIFMLSAEDISRLVDANVYMIPTIEVLDRRVVASVNLEGFVRAGGKVALGTDFGGSPSGAEMEIGMPMKEIGYMKGARMSNMQIIIAATKNAAFVCGRESDLGTLETGKVADVLVVAGNPLADLDALRQVKMVMRDGVIAAD